MATSTTQPAAQAATFTFWKIALAVFVGNLMTGVIAGLIYAFIADNRGLFQ